ncbi:MAG: deoxyribose-phosphate aldolase [Thermotogae bacterium]|nr:deoxyribose-phosphate aldolase [Thermotogota bacterium]
MNYEEIRRLAEEIEREPVDESLDIRPYIENTLLKPEATPEQVRSFCEESLRYGFLGVCVNPAYVRLAREVVGDELKVVSVVGFPLGASRSDVKAYEAAKAVEDGADEVDMVINVGLLKAGRYDEVRRDIEAVVKAAGVPVKVIIETGLLSDDEKVIACRLAEEAGAAFVKTSTGFVKGGATIYDVLLMSRATKLPVKASGGIRTKEFALKLIKAGAKRLGTSRGPQVAGLA